MSTSFTITDQAELSKLAPFLETEARKDAVNVHNFQAEAARRRGVAFSGSVPLTPPRERSDAERLLAAKAAYSVKKQFAASSRGRFLAAVAAIQTTETMYAYEAEIARKAYSRGFADENVSTHEIGVALEALAAIPGTNAAEARQALAELLMIPAREAA